MTLDTHLAHPPREGTLQSGILSEALTLQESDTKENTHQTASHTQTPPLFRQRRIPYVPRYPQQWEAFHPSSPCSRWELGSYNGDQTGTQQPMTGRPYAA